MVSVQLKRTAENWPNKMGKQIQIVVDVDFEINYNLGMLNGEHFFQLNSMEYFK
jgi:hypothetical protein